MGFEQEKMIFFSFIVEPIATKSSKTKEFKIALNFLGAIGSLEPNTSSLLLNKFLDFFIRQKKDVKTLNLFILNLKKIAINHSITEKVRIGSWIILSEIAKLDSKCISWKFILCQWNNIFKPTISIIDKMNVVDTNTKFLATGSLKSYARINNLFLCILTYCITSCHTNRKKIIEILFLTLRSFSNQPCEITKYVTILSNLFLAKYIDADTTMMWICDIFHGAKQIISAYIKNLIKACKNT